MPRPTKPPMTMPGPKMPPDPPDPMDSDVARIFTSGRASIDPQGHVGQAVVHSPLQPAVAGGERGREGETDAGRRRHRRPPA